MRLKERLKRFDIFGAKVEFFYQGKSFFNTIWGFLVTSLVCIGYISMVSLKWIEFFGETDPIDHFSETAQDMDTKTLRLQELGFSFAIDDSLDPRIGSIEASQVTWSGTDGVKYSKPIKLVPCDALLPLNLPLGNDYEKARRKSRSSVITE